MGRLIPAGTGMEFYRNVRIAPDSTVQEVRAEEIDDSQLYLEAAIAASTARPPQDLIEDEPELDEMLDADLDETIVDDSELEAFAGDELTFDEEID